MLTEKQERFIQNIVKGMTNREAYKDAYNTSSMSEAAIDVEASKLLRNPKVSLRHKELVDMAAKDSIMTAQERLEYLTNLIKEKEKEKVLVEGMLIDVPADFNAKLKAIDIMNKMQGEYTTKIEAEVNSEININIELSDD